MEESIKDRKPAFPPPQTGEASVPTSTVMEKQKVDEHYENTDTNS